MDDFPLRGVAIGLLLSLPFWVLVAVAIMRMT